MSAARTAVAGSPSMTFQISLPVFLLVASCTLPPAAAQLVVFPEHTAVSPIASAVFPKAYTIDPWVARTPKVTRLELKVDVANGIVPPQEPWRVYVPTSEQVVMVPPPEWPTAVQWTKDGVAIPGASGGQLIIPAVTRSDSGLYSIVSNAPFPRIPTRIQLEVMSRGRFGNFSARLKLTPGKDTQVVGFAVVGKETKRLLVRAVGPSLRPFGVANPAPKPRLRIYTDDGKELDLVRVAVVPPPRYWDEIFRQAGAFPLTGGEMPFVSYDALELPPSTYTVHVTDDSGTGGEVLVELYEFDTFPSLAG